MPRLDTPNHNQFHNTPPDRNINKIKSNSNNSFNNTYNFNLNLPSQNDDINCNITIDPTISVNINREKVYEGKKITETCESFNNLEFANNKVEQIIKDNFTLCNSGGKLRNNISLMSPNFNTGMASLGGELISPV